MKNWGKIEYLQRGNQRQKEAYNAIRKLYILEILTDYNPILVGTIPIEIDIPESDLDIICEVYDFDEFKSCVFENFGMCSNYVLKNKIENGENIVVVNFWFMNFEFEIYAKSKSTVEFNGYKHMIIEYRILTLLGEVFREKIVQLKKGGLKTELSFAKLLSLKGNSYDELLRLIDSTDMEIRDLFESAKT